MRLSDLYQEEEQAQEEPNYLQRSQSEFVTSTQPTYSVGSAPDNGPPRQSFDMPAGPPVAAHPSPLDLYVPQAAKLKMEKLQAGLAEAQDLRDQDELTQDQYQQYNYPSN